MRLRRVAGALASVAALGAVVPVIAATPAAASSEPEVIATGLDNPYKLTFGPDEALYVAEAGVGGDESCQEVESPEGGTSETCFGTSGAITRIEGEEQERYVEGLPSLAGPTGEEAGGPSDVVFDTDGNLYTIVGLGGDAAYREQFGEGAALMGTVLQVAPDADPTMVADLVAFEEENDPDAEQPGSEGVDSNPFGLTWVEGGPIPVLQPGSLLAVDAGGNDLLQITDGEISVVTVFEFEEAEFPPGSGNVGPMQPVPTAVELDGEGIPLVSQLTGFPFPIGAADVFEIGEDGTATSREAGFTNIIDIAPAPDGSLYVLEFASNSLLSDAPLPDLVQVRPDGTRKVILSAQDLQGPVGGVAVDAEGMVYVSVCNVCGPGAGTVLRVDPTVARDPATSAACSPEDVPGTEFGDIGQNSHREAVECAAWFGLVRGTGDGEFSPEGTTTRGQLASVMAGVLEAGGVELPEDPPDAFSDDDGDVHEEAINQLAELEVVEGFSDDTYGPSELVTRGQMASMLARAYEAITGEPLPEGDDAFEDDEDSVHEDNINAVAAAGWAEGIDGEDFAPEGSLTRGQLASFVARMVSTLVEEGHAEPPAAG